MPTGILAEVGSRLRIATARGILLVDGLVDGDAFVPTTVGAAAADHLFRFAGGHPVLAAPSGLVRWLLGRAEYVHRAVEPCTMPPTGAPLGEAERFTHAGWLAR